MNYITKDLARTIAHDLTVEIRENIQRKEKVFSEWITKEYFSQIPEEELKIVQSIDQDWIEKKDYFGITDGKSTIRFNLKKSVIVKQSFYNLTLSKEKYKEAVDFNAEIEQIKSKSSNLKEQLISMIMKAKTMQKLEKSFPEAYAKIPKEKITCGGIIAIPVEKILADISALSK